MENPIINIANEGNKVVFTFANGETKSFPLLKGKETLLPDGTIEIELSEATE